MPRFVIAAAVALMASPAQAQSEGAFCGDWDPAEVAAAVSGSWEATNTVTVSSQGFSTVMGPGPGVIIFEGDAEGGTFTVRDAAPPMPDTYEWFFGDPSSPLGPDFLVAEDSSPLGLTLDEMGLVLGCDVEDVPQLLTSIDVTTPEARITGHYVTLVFSPTEIATVGRLLVLGGGTAMFLDLQSAAVR